MIFSVKKLLKSFGVIIVVFTVLILIYNSSYSNFGGVKASLNLQKNFLSNNSRQNNRTFLAVLATSWLLEKEKENVHENVARLWSSWPGMIQPVIYTNLSQRGKSFKECVKFGWNFFPISNTKCQGIPVLNIMVIHLLKMYPNSDFYGFVNSDIVFDHGLIETFNFVKKYTKKRPVLLIGQRTNINATKPLYIHSPKDIPLLAKKGKIMRAYAIDYFLTDRSFPWHKFPDLVIGRHQYDNYLVNFGLEQKVLVIDVTQTVKAVHLTTKDGNNAGNKRHHKNCNRQMIKDIGKPFYSSWGFVTCTRNYTHRNKSGKIMMSTRLPWKFCKQSSNKL